METIGLFYLGLTLALPAWVNPVIWVLSAALGVGMILGWLGWNRATDWGFLRPYFALGGALSLWAFLSSIWAWDQDSLYHSLTFAVWLLFIVPGLAQVTRTLTNRRTLIIGIAVGTAVYGLVAAFRIATGEPVLDRVSADDLANTIFGLNRNGVNIRAVIVIPILAFSAPTARAALWQRVLLAPIAFAVLATGGRAGLVAVSFGLLLYAALQPNIGRKLRLAMVLVIAGVVAVNLLQDVEGPVGVGVQRALSYMHGERTSSDRTRELLAEKAWTVARERPVFGVGFQNFRGLSHEVELKANSSRQREKVHIGNAHNTYAQTFAEIGYIGGLFLLALVLILVRAGVRNRRHPEVRLATSAFGAVAVVLIFDYALTAVLYVPMAILLGALLAAYTGRVSAATLRDPLSLGGEDDSTDGS